MEQSREMRGVVISGLPVSGKSTLANMLSKELRRPVYSIGKIWRERWAKLYPDGAVSFEQFWRGTNAADNLQVNVEAKELFESGSVIGDSRYASFADNKKCMLVFLTADMEVRVERAAGRDDYKEKTRDEIRRILRMREDDEVKTGQELFQIDYRNPALYHIVINSGLLTPQQEFETVSALLNLRRA